MELVLIFKWIKFKIIVKIIIDDELSANKGTKRNNKTYKSVPYDITRYIFRGGHKKESSGPFRKEIRSNSQKLNDDDNVFPMKPKNKDNKFKVNVGKYLSR